MAFARGSRQTAAPTRRRMTVESVLAGIRKTETGTYSGNYSFRSPLRAGRAYYGAYQIPTEYWNDWATAAGIPGASINSPAAQDRVAAYIISQYYNRFGDWDLAAMAWYAGPMEAAKAQRRGFYGLESIQNPKIRDYVQKVTATAQYAVENPEQGFVKRIPLGQVADVRVSQGWVFPVAGQSEWSRGSWMPNSTNHRGRTHAAIDIYAKTGTPILAPVSGKVISTKKGKLGGYTVRLQGDDGIIYYFAHMESPAPVEVGQRVNGGYHIGYVGNTGSAKSTSPHLHFSMKKDNNIVSPIAFLERSNAAAMPVSIDNVDDLLTPTARRTSYDINGMLGRISQAVSRGTPTPMTELDDKAMQRAARVEDTEPEPDTEIPRGVLA